MTPPDLLIEATLVQAGPHGDSVLVRVPIGFAWRTTGGDYRGELRQSPPEWAFSEERKLFIRVVR